MIVRITRLLLVIQFAVAVAAFFAFSTMLHVENMLLAAALGIALVVIVRLAITANNFRLASRFRSLLPEQYQISRWQFCRLFFSEFVATMLSSSWSMPFRTFDKRIATQSDCLPVLLIHGYGCNSGYWNSMSKALQKADITHYALDMVPVIGGIDEYVPMVHDAVEKICKETGFRKLVIVAHSMGGLVTRAYLRDHGMQRVARAITLGTPHYGTALAHFGLGLNTQQMRWTAAEQEGIASEWLRILAAQEDPAAYRLFVSIFSHHDNIISPQTSSYLPGARNIELHAIGHVALGLAPEVQALVIREVRHASHQECHQSPDLQERVIPNPAN